MVFKELIYTLSKAVSSINVTEFSEGGRDSTKKDDLKGFKESAEVYGKGIVHFPKDCKLYCGRGLARNQSGDKKGACEKLEGKQRNNTDMYYDSNDSCPLFFVSLKVDNILYIILRLKRTNIP